MVIFQDVVEAAVPAAQYGRLAQAPLQPGKQPRRFASGHLAGRPTWQFHGAFTLIELLVVTAILGLLTAAVVSCLTGGLRVWDSVKRDSGIEAEALIGLRTVENDLMNSFQFYAISFSGVEKDIAFPGLINSPIPHSESARGGKGGVGAQIGTVKYFFDEDKKALFRKEWIYPAEEPPIEESEKLISKLEDVEMSYYCVSNACHASEWLSYWSSITNLPSGVRIELSFMDKGELVKIGRTVLLPVEDR